MAAYGSEELQRSRPNLPQYSPEYSGITQQLDLRQREIDRRRKDTYETRDRMDDYYRTAGDIGEKLPGAAVDAWRKGTKHAEEQADAKDRRRDNQQGYEMNQQLSEENKLNLEKQRMESGQAQRYREFMDQPTQPGGQSRQEQSWQLGFDQPFRAEKRSEEEFGMKKKEFALTERQINAEIARAHAQTRMGKVEAAIDDLANGYSIAYAIRDKEEREAAVAKIDAQAREILPPSKIMTAQRAGRQGALTDRATERLSSPEIARFEEVAGSVKSEASVLESMLDQIDQYDSGRRGGMLPTNASNAAFAGFTELAAEAYGSDPDADFGYDPRRPTEVGSGDRMRRFVAGKVRALERKISQLRGDAGDNKELLASPMLRNLEQDLVEVKGRLDRSGLADGEVVAASPDTPAPPRRRGRLIQGAGGNNPPPAGTSNADWLRGPQQPPMGPPLPVQVNSQGYQPMAPMPPTPSARDKMIHRQQPARNFQGGR